MVSRSSTQLERLVSFVKVCKDYISTCCKANIRLEATTLQAGADGAQRAAAVSTFGMAADCTGVGAVRPRLARALSSRGSSPNSSNDMLSQLAARTIVPMSSALYALMLLSDLLMHHRIPSE